MATHSSQYPPHISPNIKLLSSLISLPPQPHIVYTFHTPTASSSQDSLLIERARRQIIAANNHSCLLLSFLYSVRIDKECSGIYIYAITSHDQLHETIHHVTRLQFQGLTATDPQSFTPQSIYPCSSFCSVSLLPCPSCLFFQSLSPPQCSSTTPPSHTPPFTTTRSPPLFPRTPLRLPYAHFLESVTIRLIDEVSKKASGKRAVRRLKGGFLLGSWTVASGGEWGVGWECALNRPLIHVNLSLHLTPSNIIVHPTLKSTPYLPLPIPPCAPLPAGTPLTLLPHGTPAYYLTGYSGPTSALKRQFEESLDGVGVGEWKDLSYANSNQGEAPWIIAYIAVQNNNGEDKGLTIVWPSLLCLYFGPGSKQAKERNLLECLPELAAQLQPSPPPPPPNVAGDVKMEIYGEKPRVPIHRRAHSSPSSSLTMLCLGHGRRTKRDIKVVAREVGSYVDAIAREREKERERIRKERENANSPKIGIGHKSNGSGPSQTQAQPQLQVPQPLPHPSQHFYPSPPQSNPPASAPAEVPTSPEVPTTPAAEPNPSPVSPPFAADAVLPTASSSTFDPFGNIDSTWSQPPANDELMELGMDFNLNLGGHGGIDTFDDTFTDDDFNFFDRPSANNISNVVHGLPVKVEQGVAPVSSAPLGMDITTSRQTLCDGPGMSHLESPSQWTAGILGEAFTPRSTFHRAIACAPDLLPPSPGITPTSRSLPATPSVRLEEGAGKSVRGGLGPNIFDPIPFAHSHRIADGKYLAGKFALPSPPDEEDRTKPMFFPVQKVDGWKVKYNAETDPRIGIVRKLIGVKRKSSEQGTRDVKMSPRWVREYEDWESAGVKSDGDADVGMDDESEDEELDEDSRMVSRPSTPPPAYLPMGPTLLHTHFHHSQLLPLSSPLRPPGTTLMSIASAVPPGNVPTPVSPAAMAGVASEKSKSLEAAAHTIAVEVVENCVWADAWRSTVGSTSSEVDGDVWQADVNAVAHFLDDVEGMECGIELQHFFQLEGTASIEKLEPPMLSVGKSDAVIQVLPTALRFWEKLGLGPRGGKKDVIAFVLFEDDGEEKQAQVEAWLTHVSATYAAKHLGSHIAGNSPSCSKEGLVPLRFDSFRKTLASFVANLPVSQSRLVFYVVTPLSAMSLASPVLRQVFSAVKHASKTYLDAQIHFQFVPEEIMQGCHATSSSRDSEIDILCCSVYNRLLQPVDRQMSRRLFVRGERTRNYLQDPAFALARPLQSSVSFLRQTQIPSLDVVDRHTLLHIGYEITPCRKWVLACCVDQRGEAHNLGVWMNIDDGYHENHSDAVRKVWEFTVAFARKANVEWRVVVTKLGVMGDDELDAWKNHVSICHEHSMTHVSVICVEHDVPWSFLAGHHDGLPTSPTSVPSNSRNSSKDPPLFIDISASTYAMLPSTSFPFSLAPDPGRDVHYVPDSDDHPPRAPARSIRALPTTALIRLSVYTSNAPLMIRLYFLHTFKSPHSSFSESDEQTQMDVTRNYHQLAILANLRWRLGDQRQLPFHLAAIETMRTALESSECY